MKIGFIGAGKVGTSFGKYLKENGFFISGYFSKSYESTKFASDFTNSECFGDLYTLVKKSDIIFLTVKDGLICDIWKNIYSLNITGKIICHCSGALSSEVFKGAFDKGAYPCSVHPMLAVDSKDKAFNKFAKAFFTVEGDSYACDKIKGLLNSIGNSVKIIENPQKKILYHLACVFQSNLINALISYGVEFLKECEFDEKEALTASMPLILGNIHNVFENGLTASLTGPVERCDINTVEKHISILNDDYKTIYKLLSSKLADIATLKNTDICYDELKKILEVNK